MRSRGLEAVFFRIDSSTDRRGEGGSEPGPVQSRDVIFKEKKVPAASWLAATGLVKSWIVIFTEKKAHAASCLAAAGLVKSWGGDFH